MTRLPRTLRLDPSDLVVFDRAAAPGEWAVPGGFAFWDEDPAALAGKRRQAFRAGFGLRQLRLVHPGGGRRGDGPAEREAAVAALARAYPGALRRARMRPPPRPRRARRSASQTLCDHPPGTVLALSRWSRRVPCARASAPCTGARRRTAISAPCRSSASSRLPGRMRRWTIPT